jgi:hypothetical protein
MATMAHLRLAVPSLNTRETPSTFAQPPASPGSMPLEDMVTGIGDPLHAIDEPAARPSTRIHVLPHISAAHHTDGIEATRCWLWRREAWLLADCWQFWTQTPCADPVDACPVATG